MPTARASPSRPTARRSPWATTCSRAPRRPCPCALPDRWKGLVGEYGWDHDTLYILEEEGKLHALIEWFTSYPLQEEGPDRYRFPAWGLYDNETLIFTPRRRKAAPPRWWRPTSPGSGATSSPRRAAPSASQPLRPVPELTARGLEAPAAPREGRFPRPRPRGPHEPRSDHQARHPLRRHRQLPLHPGLPARPRPSCSGPRPRPWCAPTAPWRSRATACSSTTPTGPGT